MRYLIVALFTLALCVASVYAQDYTVIKDEPQYQSLSGDDGQAVLEETNRYKIRYTKIIEDIDGNPVTVLDREESQTLEGLNSQLDLLLEQENAIRVKIKSCIATESLVDEKVEVTK